jgi:hypothetical protein
MDGNMDGEISLQEWNTFFGATIASGTLIKIQ